MTERILKEYKNTMQGRIAFFLRIRVVIWAVALGLAIWKGLWWELVLVFLVIYGESITKEVQRLRVLKHMYDKEQKAHELPD